MGLGLHGGGIGTVNFLAQRGARITVTDLRDKKILAPSLKILRGYKGISYVLGRHRDEDIVNSDLIIKNPGVPPSSRYLKLAYAHHIPVTSDIGIFLRLCPAMIIGITGTRSKSTTAALIHAFLSSYQGKKTGHTKRNIYMGGNIRKSVLEFLPRMSKDDIVILELSSFQLEDIRKDSWVWKGRVRRSPHIAAITNLLRDHLNWHGSWKNYLRAKSVIVKFQEQGDYVFANPHDAEVRKIVAASPSRIRLMTLPKTWEKEVDKKLGVHYRSSVALALGIARHLGVPNAHLKRVFKEFRGLEGREEEIGSVRGVHVVNDTTSTIPEAAMAALERFDKLAGGKKLILIAGGADKKLDFRMFAMAARDHADAVVLLPGTATEQMKKNLKKQNVSYRESSSMRDAVTKAYRIAHAGDWIVLSPGAASFGLFTNEFDRGEQFVSACAKLKPLAH